MNKIELDTELNNQTDNTFSLALASPNGWCIELTCEEQALVAGGDDYGGGIVVALGIRG